ncbi:MAG: pyruvate formate lyase family protein [Chloroflexota bacterium]
MISTTAEEWLQRQIDTLQLSPRLERLRTRFFEEVPQVCANRLRLAMEGWKETEGQPVEIRSAKKLEKILEGMPVVIHDGEITAGNQSRFFRGCAPFSDWDSRYFALVTDGEKVTFGGPHEAGNISKEDWTMCQEAAAYFHGKSPAEAARGVAEVMHDDWYEDMMELRAIAPCYDEEPYLSGVPIWEKVLNKGTAGIVRDVEAAVERYRQSKEDDPEKLYFWEAVRIVCQALVTFAHRHAAVARELATKASNPERRKQLEDIAEACEWVPENPPRTFFEAVQALRLTHVAVLLENGRKAADIGRLDQMLYPFFRRDLEAGRLTLEKAADILGDYVTYLSKLQMTRELKGQEVHQATMIIHITLGGAGRDGKDASNELTYLLIHLLGLLKYAEPHATVRLSDQTPRWLLLKALETNRKVNGIPMYENDKHVIGYMVERGVPLEEARDWGIVGCSQPVASPQRHYTVFQMHTVLPLDLVLHNGVSPINGKKMGLETGDPRNLKTFDEFYDAYKKQYEFVFRRLFRLQRLMYLTEVQLFRMPLRSALDFASVENGKSHLTGGCGSYPLWHAKDRGMVDTGDSLTAIKKLVFDEKKLTMAELLDAIDSNFEGTRGEEIRQMCLSAPKYGNDIDEADSMVRDVAKFSASVIFSEKNVFGYPYSINRNGVSWHYGAGKGVGALPNGRKAGTPLVDGSLSPMAGMDRNGPTAVLNSALKADYKESLVAILNQKFPLTVASNPETMEKIAALTTTFINNGGLHIQFNFIDRNVLLDAKKHPERYKDLVVRVAGYSAYFVNLSPEIQDEIIARTEQSL